VQLGDCRLERRDKEPVALTSNETKAIERIECIENLEINIDREVVCEPRLDTRGATCTCLPMASSGARGAQVLLRFAVEPRAVEHKPRLQ
jgi:hypothetical protein